MLHKVNNFRVITMMLLQADYVARGEQPSGTNAFFVGLGVIDKGRGAK